ncbi:hypothetical protein RO3G_15344 [Rhizopus delemar RA 99-880]|uniref:Uncharacterized protein n=1 Tax=Rhizopus delemar (strain RA 99-880 / ATCC MYA-4621 / FGSC 9543 / NRRL 43880) TaxID=246409 RepID=I1CQA3_RHIO9|nr:hypothetical protein RO3G_15344 [Rhizopus delemar RA 99-880]|eukprot:EIE90633.1 hypothetical protein RO3G_15344 [Rhizopus delemar RA 99-880]
MKFSVAAISALVLSTAVSFTTADSYSDAMKSWCGGLDVTFPTASTVVVAGSKTKVTVRKAKYVQNVWKGKYALQSSASITDTIPKSAAAGLYYYRVWVTNLVNGQHGPDCLETSHTFKVTSGSHTNAAGVTEYAEHLDDANIYSNEHYNGCFGLSVDYPKAGSTFNVDDHIHIQVDRDSTSQTDSLTKVELYKGDELVETAWSGSEALQNSFTLKDHLKLDNVDTSADYHYKLQVTSKKSDTSCTFESNTFKISN